jgi:hypothetical protein
MDEITWVLCDDASNLTIMKAPSYGKMLHDGNYLVVPFFKQWCAKIMDLVIMGTKM